MKKIMMWCQSSYGMGHLVVTLALAEELAKENQVLVVYGGQLFEGFKKPKGIRFVHLPVLVDDLDNRRILVSLDHPDIETVKEVRTTSILREFDSFNPDIVIVEHYPFGRHNFDFELIPFLDKAKQKNKTIVSSFRGILGHDVDKERLLYLINNFFDYIFVHTDPKITKIEDELSFLNQIKAKFIYTGYVTRGAELIDKEIIRKKMKIADNEKLILVCVGGGKDGFNIIKKVIKSRKEIKKPVKIIISTGPYVNEEDFKNIEESCDKYSLVIRYLPDIISYINTSDCVISMAGYNTIAELLLTNSRAIIIPRNKQEQIRRAKNMAEFFDIILPGELENDKLSFLINQNLVEH